MKLYLDDQRPCPVGWTLARTAAQAIGLLKTGRVTHASLDHDLKLEHYPENMGGKALDDGETGMAVVLWMQANDVWPAGGVKVHSLNPTGRVRMEAIIRDAYRGRA